MSVECWQDTITLRTYLQGPPDPHPCFHRPIYPYTMQDDLTHECADRDYLALHLQNEFLHVIVLPELGGRVFSAWDRIARREVFYRNNVVKPAMVALRGAWISGGIEFNFFHRGHSQTTMAPVSYQLQPADEASQGSARITVSNIDLTSRARWEIALSLQPGDPRLHQHVSLRNRMPYRQRYYFWANAALPATDDLQLVYPARKARLSREGVVDYPLWQGRDLSLYRNHITANDIFTLDVHEDFFGCYYPEQDAGLAHVADHAHSVGKKFFTWGTEDAGMIWVDLLTDEDGQYVELQSGRFVDQSIYEFMRPFQAMQWEERWWPLHGIGGWTWASDDAVLNFRLQGTRARIGALTWAAHQSARISVSAAGRLLWSHTADLGPTSPFAGDTDLGEAACSHDELLVTIEGGGRELLRYVHPPAFTRLPSVVETGERERPEPTPEEQASAGELHLRALEHELAGRWSDARRLWEVALERDPVLSGAHVGLGLLAYRAGRAEEAHEQFARAVALNRHDYEAKYYLALADLALDRREAAREGLERLVALGVCAEEAKALLTRVGGAGCAAVSPAARLDRPEILRDEPEQWLEVASDYAAVGLLEQAIGLLRRGCLQVPRVAGSPLVHYTLAHYLGRAGDEDAARSEREQARACDPAGCAAWRLEDLDILGEAIERDSDDWVARCLLGTLLAGLGRTEEALEAWLAAVRLDDSFAPLLRNLGWAKWHWREDAQEAERWYRRAIERAPEQYRLYIELDSVLEAAQRPPQERLEVLRSAPPAVQDKWQMAARLAGVLVALGRWEEALAELEGHRFIPWEGARGMRALWVEALLGRATALAAAGDFEGALAACWRALEYPRNIGVGRQARPAEDARIWLAAAEIAGRAGDAQARTDYEARARELSGE
ncbi:MAG: DUF5107 domain-containing protein [Armatimonadota bacterium]